MNNTERMRKIITILTESNQRPVDNRGYPMSDEEILQIKDRKKSTKKQKKPDQSKAISKAMTFMDEQIKDELDFLKNQDKFYSKDTLATLKDIKNEILYNHTLDSDWLSSIGHRIYDATQNSTTSYGDTDLSDHIKNELGRILGIN